MATKKKAAKTRKKRPKAPKDAVTAAEEVAEEFVRLSGALRKAAGTETGDTAMFMLIGAQVMRNIATSWALFATKLDGEE